MPKPKLDPDTGCWIWQGSISCGYGKLSYNGKSPEWAHRAYYHYVYGDIPGGQDLHHTCRNRICVNPDHLELLTPRAHGREAEAAKLNLVQVNEIRRRLAAGEGNTRLANEFGVTRQTIGDIKFGRTWQTEVSCPNCSHVFDPYD